MKALIQLSFILLFGISYSQEKAKEKQVQPKEVKELEKELNKRETESNELKEFIKKSNEFIDSKKDSEKKTQKKLDRERLIQILKSVQEPKVESVIADEIESEDTGTIESIEYAPDAEYIDELEMPNNLKSDRKRLKGPTQFDSRIEIRTLSAEIDWQWLILQRNKSVGLVVDKRELKSVGNGVYQLNASNSMSTKYNICEDEPFAKQPTIGVGTSFIIDKNQMITAQHVFTKSLNNYVIVFGYELFNQNGLVETIVTEANLYYPKKKIKNSKELDVTIFEVNREFKTREPLKWKISKDLKKGREVYLIGHPTGLPKKVALNASILDNTNQQYFYTSLDSFQGNSGSPVFDFITHKVIGVLVSGEIDYNFNGSCYESNLCKIPYCKGEKVIRIENILIN